MLNCTNTPKLQHEGWAFQLTSFWACISIFLFIYLSSTKYSHHILHFFILYALAVLSWEHTNWCTEKGTGLCLCICRLHFTSGAMGLPKKRNIIFYLFWTRTDKKFFLNINMWQNFKATKSSVLSESSIIGIILYIVI